MQTLTYIQRLTFEADAGVKYVTLLPVAASLYKRNLYLYPISLSPFCVRPRTSFSFVKAEELMKKVRRITTALSLAKKVPNATNMQRQLRKAIKSLV